MRAPEITYQYTSQVDVAGPSFEVLNHTEQSSVGAILIEFFLGGISRDRMLILTNFTANCEPGATQAVTEIAVQGITGTGTNFNIAALRPLAVADQKETLNWSGSVNIMGALEGANSIRVLGVFDAAVNANFVNFAISGIVVPRGNAGAF